MINVRTLNFGFGMVAILPLYILKLVIAYLYTLLLLLISNVTLDHFCYYDPFIIKFSILELSRVSIPKLTLLSVHNGGAGHSRKASSIPNFYTCSFWTLTSSFWKGLQQQSHKGVHVHPLVSLTCMFFNLKSAIGTINSKLNFIKVWQLQMGFGSRHTVKSSSLLPLL